MIPNDILERLVPEQYPGDEFEVAPDRDRRVEEPARRISAWARHLRLRLAQIARSPKLSGPLDLDRAGLIGTGIFHAPEGARFVKSPGFPEYDGYQFGVMLLRGDIDRRKETSYISPGIPLARGYQAPVIEVRADQELDGGAGPNGYVSAVYRDANGAARGITARHIVNRHRFGSSVPIHCSVCGAQARLRGRAPGEIDAAVVEFDCGGPNGGTSGGPPEVTRGAIEGETVEAHFGGVRKEALHDHAIGIFAIANPSCRGAEAVSYRSPRATGR